MTRGVHTTATGLPVPPSNQCGFIAQNTSELVEDPVEVGVI